MKRLLPLLLVAASQLGAAGESIPEPETTFYGKVLVPWAGGHHQVTEGTMTWAVGTPDGGEDSWSTSLEALGAGAFSYRLALPHSAATSGVTVDEESIGLGVVPAPASLLEIRVDGVAATIIDPAGGSFELAQALRGATHRVDVLVVLDLPDSDEDGIDDWWEDLHGLLAHDGSDAGDDPDGDGRTNRGEFLAGSDPNHDDRVPQIVTSELVIHDGLRSGVLLEVLDLDTALADLRFEVVDPGSGVDLFLAGRPAALAAGDGFTGEDMTFGRLGCRAGAVPFEGGTVRIRVAEAADPLRSSVADIEVRPAGVFAAEAGFAHLELAREQSRVVWDLRDRATAFHLDLSEAGTGSLLFVDGEGGILTASPGSDRVVLTGEGTLDMTIAGFAAAGHDQIDLGGVIGADATGADVRSVVSFEDAVVAAASARIAIPGVEVTLRDLWEWEMLLADGLVLPPLVSVAAVVETGWENGPREAAFEVRRTGRPKDALVVGLALSGPAVNGVDYAYLDETVTIPAGASTARVVVRPHADGEAEPSEVVALRLVADPAYEFEGNSAEVTIEDLLPEVSVEVLQRVADVAEGGAAYLLVRRSGILNRNVFVRLAISGTASPGSDFEPLLPFLELAAFQTAALVEIRGLPGGEIAPGGESVNVTIVDDPAYLPGRDSAAGVVLVAGTTTYAAESASDPDLSFESYVYPSWGLRPRTIPNREFLEIEFGRRADAADLEWIVEYSEDLADWQPGGAHVKEVTPTWEDGDVSRVRYRVVEPMTARSRQFLRVRVEPR